MELGTKLKEAREAKGLSLEDIQHETKIQVRYLKAIEKNDFSVMPGNFYVRAFIKEYATAVGLDPIQLIEEHKAELPASNEDTTTQYSRVKRSRKDSTSTKSPKVFSYMPTIIVVLLIVGIVFSYWYFSGAGNNATPEDENNGSQSGDEVQFPTDDDNSDPAPDNEEPAEEEEPPLVEPEPALNVESQGTEGNNPLTSYQFDNPNAEINVVLETDYKNWLEVENGKGKSFHYGEFNEDASPLEIDMTGEEELYFRFGEPSHLKITINGVQLQLPEGYDPVKVQRVRVYVNQTE